MTEARDPEGGDREVGDLEPEDGQGTPAGVGGLRGAELAET